MLITAAVISIGLGAWLAGRLQFSDGSAPSIGGDFSLQSLQGPVSLNQFGDKLVVLYFGYTSCPDVCPTTLYALTQALEQLSPQEQQQIQAIFISVDPERDDPQKLAEYAKHFHPQMIGATATAEEIAELAKRYRVFYRKVSLPDSALGYSVDHSSVLYLVDTQGTLLNTISLSHSAPAIFDALREALSNREDAKAIKKG